MKFKVFFLIALICTVFAAGCLDSNQDANVSNQNNNNSNQTVTTSINPLNKTIEPYESAFPENIPYGDDIILFKPWANTSTVGYSNETLLPESDIAFYGTVKTINPSVWSTVDQNPPVSLSNAPVSTTTFGFENGTRLEYNMISIPGVDDSICTPVTFEINHMIKGENTTEVTVMIQSGQIDNYISLDSYYPIVWDLKEGQEYLVYVKNWGTENNTVMYPGFFVVIE